MSYLVPKSNGGTESPELFKAAMNIMAEDYPPRVYNGLWNMFDSHDTRRLLWDLTPSADNNTAKTNPVALATGKQLLVLAWTVMFTLPGNPMIYYGNEIGLTGDNDPDDRRTFPWVDTGTLHLIIGIVNDTYIQRSKDAIAYLEANLDPEIVEATPVDFFKNVKQGVGSWPKGDMEHCGHVSYLSYLRNALPVFKESSPPLIFRADSSTKTLGYLLRSPKVAAMVFINSGTTAQNVTFSIPDGTVQSNAKWQEVSESQLIVKKLVYINTTNGAGSVTIPAMSARIFVDIAVIPLVLVPAPTVLAIKTSNSTSVTFGWKPPMLSIGSSYYVYKALYPGGNPVKIGSTSSSTFTDLHLTKTNVYSVRRKDIRGLLSSFSNEIVFKH